jgi:hypothetical protein
VQKGTAPNPAPEWINDLMWDELLSLSGLTALEGIDTTFKDDIVEVQRTASIHIFVLIQVQPAVPRNVLTVYL